jgi:hypothetical protein
MMEEEEEGFIFTSLYKFILSENQTRGYQRSLLRLKIDMSTDLVQLKEV